MHLTNSSESICHNTEVIYLPDCSDDLIEYFLYRHKVRQSGIPSEAPALFVYCESILPFSVLQLACKHRQLVTLADIKQMHAQYIILIFKHMSNIPRT